MDSMDMARTTGTMWAIGHRYPECTGRSMMSGRQTILLFPLPALATSTPKVICRQAENNYSQPNCGPANLADHSV